VICDERMWIISARMIVVLCDVVLCDALPSCPSSVSSLSYAPTSVDVAAFDLPQIHHVVDFLLFGSYQFHHLPHAVAPAVTGRVSGTAPQYNTSTRGRGDTRRGCNSCCVMLTVVKHHPDSLRAAVKVSAATRGWF
jgi:hypothetical protein